MGTSGRTQHILRRSKAWRDFGKSDSHTEKFREIEKKRKVKKK